MKFLAEYRELIVKKEFFEAHEILEEEWHKIRKTDNELKWALKGLINAAVAMELKRRKRNNFHRVWKTFEKYEKFYNLNNELRYTADFVKEYKP